VVDEEPHPELAVAADGAASVESYTVQHDRDGHPAVGIIVARLSDGRRCWANSTDTALLQRVEEHEFIGQQGRVRHQEPDAVNLFET